MRRSILILIIFASILVSFPGQGDQEPLSSANVDELRPHPLEDLRKDFIALGAPLKIVPTHKKLAIIQRIEETLAGYEGPSDDPLKQAAADALSRVITNDDRVADLSLVTRASTAAYNLGTGTPELKQALYDVYRLEDERIDREVSSGKQIEDMAGKKFPAGSTITPWQKAQLHHQNSARALTRILSQPEKRPFNPEQLDALKIQEPTEQDMEIFSRLIMNQELPPSARYDAIATAIQYHDFYKKNAQEENENDEQRLFYIESELAEAFDQNIRYHKEPDIAVAGAAALSHINHYDTLGEGLLHRMEKNRWYEAYPLKEQEAYGTRAESEVISSMFDSLVTGSKKPEYREDALPHMAPILNDVFEKWNIFYNEGSRKKDGINESTRIRDFFQEIKQFLLTLSPEERLEILEKVHLPEDLAPGVKIEYEKLLAELGLEKVGDCDDGHGGKSPEKIVLGKSLTQKIEEIRDTGKQVAEQGQTLSLNTHNICSPVGAAQTETAEDKERKIVLQRLLDLRGERIKEMSKTFQSLRTQGFLNSSDVPAQCQNEFSSSFNEAAPTPDTPQNLTDEQWQAIYNQAIEDSYALAETNKRIKDLAEGGINWQVGEMTDPLGQDKREKGIIIKPDGTREEIRAPWTNPNRYGVGYFPSTGFSRDPVRDIFGKDYYNDYHNRINKYRDEYDKQLRRTGGIASGLVRTPHSEEKTSFHDFVQNKVHFEDALKEEVDHSDKRLKFYEQIEEVPDSDWNPFWKEVFFTLDVPIHLATKQVGATIENPHGFNNHAERAYVDYPRLINNLKDEIKDMERKIFDPSLWNGDQFENQELLSQYENYKEALNRVRARYQQKKDDFKRQYGVSLVKEANQDKVDKFKKYLGELCEQGMVGNTEEKIEALRYLALDEELRKKTLSSENHESDCALSKEWASYLASEASHKTWAHVGAAVGTAITSAIAGKFLGPWGLIGGVAGGEAAGLAIDAHYHAKNRELADRLSLAYQASGGKFGTTRTVLEYENKAADALDEFWMGVKLLPLAFLTEGSTFRALGTAANAFRGAKRFNDAKRVLRARGLLSQARTLKQINPKRAQALMDEATGILKTLGEASGDAQVAKALTGQATQLAEDMARNRALHNAFGRLRDVVERDMLPTNFSRLSQTQAGIARKMEHKKLMPLMKAITRNTEGDWANPEVIEQFAQSLKRNQSFRESLPRIMEAFGNDTDMIRKSIERAGGFEKWAAATTTLAKSDLTPLQLQKFFLGIHFSPDDEESLGYSRKLFDQLASTDPKDVLRRIDCSLSHVK